MANVGHPVMAIQKELTETITPGLLRNEKYKNRIRKNKQI